MFQIPKFLLHFETTVRQKWLEWKIDANCLTFSPSVEIRGGVDKNRLSGLNRFNLGPNLWYTFAGRLCAGWGQGAERLMFEKSTAVKHEISWLSSSGLKVTNVSDNDRLVDGVSGSSAWQGASWWGNCRWQTAMMQTSHANYDPRISTTLQYIYHHHHHHHHHHH